MSGLCGRQRGRANTPALIKKLSPRLMLLRRTNGVWDAKLASAPPLPRHEEGAAEPRRVTLAQASDVDSGGGPSLRERGVKSLTAEALRAS